MLPQQQAPINIVPPQVVGQVERKRSLHEEMGAKGLLVKQGSGCQNDCQRGDYAAGPLPGQRLQGQLPPQGFVAGQQQFAAQNFQVAGQLPTGLPNVGISPVPTDPFIQKAQGIRPGEGLLYDARGLPLDSQGYLPNTGPTIGQRMRDAAHIGEPNGQSHYVDVHSLSTGSFEQAPLPPVAPIREDIHRKEVIRDQAVLPPQPLPPQQLPPQGQFVQQQQGQFIQQQPVGVAPVQPVIPVKGVGIMDKLYMGAHNLKEHLKDKLYAHQETKEIKRMAEAEMKAERRSLEAQQYPIQAQMEGERKALIQQQEMVVGGLKSELSAERAAFEQNQAAIQAQLDAERRAFLQQQEAKLGGLQAEFDATREVLHQQQSGVEAQLELERRLLKEQQDAAAQGLKFDLVARRKEIEAAGLQKRAVENQIFANQVIAEHTKDALKKEARLGLKAERHVLEANLAQQTAMEQAAFKQQATLEKEAIQQQAFIEGQALQQQQAAFIQQSQQQFIQQPPQQFVQPPQQIIEQPIIVQQAPGIIEKETRIIKEEILPGGVASNRLQGVGSQVQNAAYGSYNQATAGLANAGGAMLNQGSGLMNQGAGYLNQGGHFIDQAGNLVERRVSGDVKDIRGGQEFKQEVKDIVRDPTGRVIADAKNIEKDRIQSKHGDTQIKHEEKVKVNEH